MIPAPAEHPHTAAPPPTDPPADPSVTPPVGAGASSPASADSSPPTSASASAAPPARPNRRARERQALAVNLGYTYRTVIEAERHNHLVVDYLAADFPHSTRDEWLARLARGEVQIAGEPVTAERVLRAGELVEWHRPGWLEPAAPREFTLLHLDDDLLAVSKPSGLPSLPGAGYLDNTLLSLVQRDYPGAHPLHRLGRATSGIVLFARRPEIAATLSRHWPRLRKVYRALAQGVADRDLYDITTPIGPQPHPRLGTVHAAHPAGKPAHSVARVLTRFTNATLFEVEISTGRPHQIRIHLASIGHPLVGDPLYAVGGLPRDNDPGLPGDPGYHLHAHRLELDHPTTGVRLELVAPPPPELLGDIPPDSSPVARGP